MIDFLVSILEANINFQTVGAVIILYFAAIWVLFCLWVFMDARGRFERTPVAVFFFFIVLVFNFPGLIFYLIIRPDKNEDNVIYLQNNEVVGESDRKGVDVPIINFVGEDGSVNLSFELKINRGIINNINSGSENPTEIVQVNVGQAALSKASDNKELIKNNSESIKEIQEVISNEIKQNKNNKSYKIVLSSIKSMVLSNISTLKSRFIENSDQVEALEVSVSSDTPSNSSGMKTEEKQASTLTNQASKRSKRDKNKKKKRRR